MASARPTQTNRYQHRNVSSPAGTVFPTVARLVRRQMQHRLPSILQVSKRDTPIGDLLLYFSGHDARADEPGRYDVDAHAHVGHGAAEGVH